MITTEKAIVTVRTKVNAPIEKVWKFFTDPMHIIHWNNASDDWHTPYAENELRAGGRFLSRMEAKDGSAGFNFSGVYDVVVPHKQIEYTIDDGRKVKIIFNSRENETEILETFEAEEEHSVEMQQEGWQSIMNNFKKYVESSDKMIPLHFEINIKAPVEKVYNTMIDEKGFSEWTSIFNATSHFEGSWEKNSRIKFLGNDQDGKMGGMLGRIRENIPNSYISIEYYGIIKDGEEVTSGPDIEGWAGGIENYTFTENGGNTFLSIDVDANSQFVSYFNETWPQALNKLKEICEQV